MGCYRFMEAPMVLTTLLAALAAQGVPAAGPAREIRPAPAIQIRASGDRYRIPRDAQPVMLATFDIDISARGARLWSGPLRVSTNEGASFSRTVQQATPCEKQNGARSQSETITLSLAQQRNTDADRYDLTVNWERPGPEAGSCKGGRSTRETRLNEAIDLPPGGQVTVNGDGGLTITLRRR